MTKSPYLIFILLFVALCAQAQKEKKASGEYIYYAPENVTLEQAKFTALERVKIQIIADNFGTIVTQSTFSQISTGTKDASNSFFSLGGSDVKGEWLETIGEPVYQINYQNSQLVVKVALEGRIREIISAPIDFDAKLLCNGTDSKYEQDTFKEGDDLYLSFKTPVDGYLATYLLDNSKHAFCLLPYRNSTEGTLPVKHYQSYLFFSSRNVPVSEASGVDEYVMTCDRSVEYNEVYIIFSPHVFTRALDDDSNAQLPRQLNYESFQKWLFNCRKHDKDMRVQVKYITIHKKNQ